MARVLLTGAGGFLGSHVLPRLLAAGASVRCAARPGGRVRLERALGPLASSTEIVEGALAAQDDCERLVESCDVVVHLAAAKTGHSSVLFAQSVTPTRALAHAAAAGGVRRFVHVSSLGVYAPQQRGALLDERSAVDPRPQLRDPYTFSKIAQEDVVWQAAREQSLNVVVIRPGVIFGPGAAGGSGGSYLSARVGLGAGGWMCVMGGKHRLPYTFVENCADAIVRAVFQPSIDGQIFNVVDDELPTGCGLVAHARARGCRFRNVRVPAVAIGPAARVYEWCSARIPGVMPSAISAYRARAQWTPVRYSNAKAKAVLGWQPAVALSDALERCRA